MELVGAAVTANIGAQTVTATLSATEVSAITGATMDVRWRTSATNFAFDNAVFTGQKTIAASTGTDPGLPKVTVYNGGAAGETTAYHRARITQMRSGGRPYRR
ncbi:hypothetical protein IWX65_002959 [Arthrobacter sp. CAN_A214]|uniref:hypothetical protein n=1 Tax=Arthrobacter sp. CAN_A214 TaxID=2787720 RepID=UPI0018CAFF4D